MTDHHVLRIQQITENDKIFEITKYNDIEIIIDTTTSYINATKLCNSQGKDFRTFCKSKRFHALTKIFEENSDEQKCSVVKYELNSRFSYEIRGQYIYPKYINFVCEWCNITYALKVAHMMDLINEELKLRQISFEQKISEQEELVKQLTTKIKNMNSGFNRERAGTIRISPHKTLPNCFNIDRSTVVRTARTTQDIIIKQVYNASEVTRLANYYAKHKLLTIDKIEWIKYNTFKVSSVDDLIEYIQNIRNYQLEIDNTYSHKIFELIKTQYIKVRRKESMVYYYSKMFEYYCALKYGFHMYSYALVETLGLTKVDIGCDLIDLKDRRIAQCKFYTSNKNKLTDKNLKTFYDFCESFPDYEQILFINEGCCMTINPPESIQIVEISEDIISNFIEEWEVKSVEYFKQKEQQIEETDEEVLKQQDIIIAENAEIREKRITRDTKRKKHSKTADTIRTSIQLQGYKFTTEQIDEMHAYLTKLIPASGYPLDKAIEEINSKFDVNFNSAQFGVCFDKIYYKNTHGHIPVSDGIKMLYPANTYTFEDEEEFIKSYIGISEYLDTDYLPVHNDHFKTRYIMKEFKIKFKHLFDHQTDCLRKRTIDGKKRTVFLLCEPDDRDKIYMDYICNEIDTTDFVLMTELLGKFNNHFHTYWSRRVFCNFVRKYNLVTRIRKINGVSAMYVAF